VAETVVEKVKTLAKEEGFSLIRRKETIDFFKDGHSFHRKFHRLPIPSVEDMEDEEFKLQLREWLRSEGTTKKPKRSDRYAENDPRGWCGDASRGAALGRPHIGADRVPVGIMRLNRVELDAGGYDRLGTYFGLGPPLWFTYGSDSEDESIEMTFRAESREDAESKVLRSYPTAKFR
jgi:hypothetical protein